MAAAQKQLPQNAGDIAVDYLCVLDFEAQCEDNVRLNPQEIIEFPTVILDVKNNKIVSEFHTYVKPEQYPVLTDFCTQLTGITQDKVDNGVLLLDALKQHTQFLQDNGLLKPDGPTMAFVTCGDWDLKTCLPKQLEFLKVDVPAHYKNWINIKFKFHDHYRVRPKGMTDMLNHLGLDLIGRHHSGIDDTRNIASICMKMIEDHWNPVLSPRIEKPKRNCNNNPNKNNNNNNNNN